MLRLRNEKYEKSVVDNPELDLNKGKYKNFKIKTPEKFKIKIFRPNKWNEFDEEEYPEECFVAYWRNLQDGTRFSFFGYNRSDKTYSLKPNEFVNNLKKLSVSVGIITKYTNDRLVVNEFSANTNIQSFKKAGGLIGDIITSIDGKKVVDNNSYSEILKNKKAKFSKEFIDGQWAFFKKAWDQKRLYKGKKSMHWDAETETSLAKHELEYKSIKDTSVFLKFKKKSTEKGNEYFIIWTTTPWTIPFNLAIMVNPNLIYVKVKVGNEIWILAKDLAGVFISGLLGGELDIVEEFKGSMLEGQEYEHFFYKDLKEVYDKLKKESKHVHTIVMSKEYVDTKSGTGLVHCAPGCGPGHRAWRGRA
ncbi:MAG: class I tRNA ligase family protein [Bacteroidetes bacterium]|nr:class I tRNA ligase family protein [Bacteroidota bacterium]